jgi:electron transfer flavoprotein alpha subunit
MTTILVCIETRDGKIQPVGFELLTAARQLADAAGGKVEALVVSASATLIGGEALGGADRVVRLSHAALENCTAEAYGVALAAAIDARHPDIVLCAYSTLGLDVGPGTAARLGWPLVAYCTSLSWTGDAVAACSQIYSGKLLAETRTPLPAIFMVNPGCHAEAPPRPASADQIIELSPPDGLADPRVRVVQIVAPTAGLVDLTKAERIVCVGRGIGDRDSIALAEDVAGLLGAELAGSRPVVDSGWLPKERQVGKSGRKVAPKLYLAAGVSGAPEHLEGMSRAELIVAVNADAKAPIFDVAHYGTTCDLFDLLPALAERLRAGES